MSSEEEEHHEEENHGEEHHEEENHEEEHHEEENHEDEYIPISNKDINPQPSIGATPPASPLIPQRTSPQVSPQTSPHVSPQASAQASPHESPKASPKASPQASPEASPQASPQTTPEASPRTSTIPVSLEPESESQPQSQSPPDRASISPKPSSSAVILTPIISTSSQPKAVMYGGGRSSLPTSITMGSSGNITGGGAASGAASTGTIGSGTASGGSTELFIKFRQKIENQKRYVNDMKALICEKNKEYPKTTCEQKELACLEERLAEEICKLKKYTLECMNELKGANEIFMSEIPLATTLDEDASPKVVSFGNFSPTCTDGHAGESCANYNPQADCVKLVMSSVNEEMAKLQRENKILAEAVQHSSHKRQLPLPPLPRPCGKGKDKHTTQADLGQQYTLLLQDYSKKEVECLDLKNQLKEKTACVKTEEEKLEELELYKSRCEDLLSEQNDLKVLITEQSSHLEEYRIKYLGSLQKIEEQKCELNCMGITNTKVEEQINCHIQNIKAKCDDKLKEFEHLPALLDEQQTKLRETLAVKECLEEKLRDIVDELDMTKAQLLELGGSKNRTADLEKELQDTKDELDCLTEKFLQLKNDKELITVELNDTKDELSCLQKESASIILRTQERSELNRKILQENINKLETDLAQTRAAACLTALNREETIREMKEKITVLANSFDGAQMHIQTLRNQVSFFCNLQNIQPFPAPCNMKNRDDGI